MTKDVDVNQSSKTMFTKEDLQNIMAIIGTHPTPEGISSQAAQIKALIIQKCQTIINELK